MEQKITVVDWISDGETRNREVAIGGWGGWFGYDQENRDSDNKWRMAHHRWKDYIEHIRPQCIPYAEALREECVKHNIRMTGEQHQYDSRGTPVFSDGKIGSFSMRAWGDLMAAVWSEAKDKDYGYMDFYM